jgi:hypothetical protein
MKETLGFASLPRGRFAFIGAIAALKELALITIQARLTALNILWNCVSTVILKGSF